MKSRKPWLPLIAVGTVLATGVVMAQDTPPTAGQASYQTPQGELTVRSAPAPAPQIAPAPPFSQLAGGGKGISEQQASAYPPLANDFLHADSNRNGSISADEYARWSKQP